MKPSLTIIFITKNEAYHICAAIENVRDIAAEIFVVDSGSTDGTIELARERGAKVLHHDFEGFGRQWNWALDNCPITSSWTMKMDPDERLSKDLKEEIVSAVSADDPQAVGYSFDRVLWFMGRRLDGVKCVEERIWRTGRCRFTDISVNEHPVIDGKWIKLKGLMEHLDSCNLTDWFDKQNDYTLKEAQQRVDGEKLPVKPKLFGNRLERRMLAKWLFRRLPMKYFIENMYYFIWRGAWKSGAHGWCWVKCREIVSRMCEYKYKEMMVKE